MARFIPKFIKGDKVRVIGRHCTNPKGCKVCIGVTGYVEEAEYAGQEGRVWIMFDSGSGCSGYLEEDLEFLVDYNTLMEIEE